VEVTTLKKNSILIILIVGLIVCIFSLNSTLTLANESKCNSSTGSNEELYQDIFTTLIYPYIKEAIEEYYGKPYCCDPWDIKILNIERQSTACFIVKIQIIPYTGAHNTVGIDNITIRISSEEAKVEGFEHIKSYEIPPWLR